jgi:hypothetical protein
VIVAAHLGDTPRSQHWGEIRSARKHSPMPRPRGEKRRADVSARPSGREILSRRFAQKIGISLAGLGKLDDALGDDLINAGRLGRKGEGPCKSFRMPRRVSRSNDTTSMKVRLSA